MRTYSDNDTGAWMKHNGKTGEESGYVQVNIIEFSDGFARTVGTNIPLDEFERDYKRADEISAGPWANMKASDFGGLDINLDLTPPEDNVANVVSQSPAQSQSIVQHVSTQNTIVSNNILDEANESPEHQLIRNAIKLSKNQSDVTFEIDYQIPFDFSKVKTIMSTMGIESSVLVDVLMENIKRHPEGFFLAIEKSLTKLIEEPEATSK